MMFYIEAMTEMRFGGLLLVKLNLIHGFFFPGGYLNLSPPSECMPFLDSSESRLSDGDRHAESRQKGVLSSSSWEEAGAVALGS